MLRTFASITQVVGLTATCAGAWWLSGPAGLFVTGIAVTVVGIAVERR